MAGLSLNNNILRSLIGAGPQVRPQPQPQRQILSQPQPQVRPQPQISAVLQRQVQSQPQIRPQPLQQQITLQPQPQQSQIQLQPRPQLPRIVQGQPQQQIGGGNQIIPPNAQLIGLPNLPKLGLGGQSLPPSQQISLPRPQALSLPNPLPSPRPQPIQTMALSGLNNARPQPMASSNLTAVPQSPLSNQSPIPPPTTFPADPRPAPPQIFNALTGGYDPAYDPSALTYDQSRDLQMRQSLLDTSASNTKDLAQQQIDAAQAAQSAQFSFQGDQSSQAQRAAQALAEAGYGSQSDLQSSYLSAQAAAQQRAIEAQAAQQQAQFDAQMRQLLAQQQAAAQSAQQQNSANTGSMELAARLRSDADNRVMSSIQGLLRQFNVAGGGAQVPTIYQKLAQEDEARRSAFARAKDKVGKIGRSALDALMNVAGARGLVGSGMAVGESGKILGGGAEQLSEMVRQQAITDAEMSRQRASEEYMGSITQRGQDIASKNQIASSLLGLMGARF